MNIDDRLGNFGFLPLGAAQAFTALLGEVEPESQAEATTVGIAAFIDAHFGYLTTGQPSA
jgi:hypothetical protein